MKIGYFADGPWAHNSLNKMLEIDDIEIGFIVGRFSNGGDKWLRSKALELGVPYIIYENINAKEVIEKLNSYKCDLFISMSFDQIIKEELINLPLKGFINCHAGALPFYRGRNILNWALINGEKTYGITVHYIDTGIDTGDIIRQVIYDIAEDDDYRTLLDKSFVRCADVLVSALRDIINNEVNTIKQASIDGAGSYYRRRKQGDEYCSFHWPVKKIYDFIRGISCPAPCARVFCDEKEIAILKSKLDYAIHHHISAEPGTIVAKDDDGIVVSCLDGFIKITLIADCYGLEVKNVRLPDMPVGLKFYLPSEIERVIAV